MKIYDNGGKTADRYTIFLNKSDYLIATKGGRQHKVELKAVCGPGDTIEPVITIMLPDED